MDRQDCRGHAGVISQRVGVAPEEQLGFNTTTVTLNVSRIVLDQASKLPDRLFISALVNGTLPLFDRTRLVPRRRIGGGQVRAEDDGEDRRNDRGGERFHGEDGLL